MKKYQDVKLYLQYELNYLLKCIGKTLGGNQVKTAPAAATLQCA